MDEQFLHSTSYLRGTLTSIMKKYQIRKLPDVGISFHKPDNSTTPQYLPKFKLPIIVIIVHVVTITMDYRHYYHP